MVLENKKENNMFLHEAAFFISVFILFGMVFYLCEISRIAVLFLFVFVFSSLFIYGFIFNRDKILKISFLSFFILTGFFYAFWFEGKKEKMLVLPDFREVFVFKVVVSSEPMAAEKHQAIRAQLIFPYSGEILIYIDPFLEVRQGDVLKVEGKVEKREKKEPLAFFPKIEVLEKGSGGVSAKLFYFKSRTIAFFYETIPQKEAALLSGLVFGDKEGFTSEFKDNLAKSGTTHIVALSGFNITILVSAIALIFGYFFSRRLTFFLTVFAIVLFTIMVGAEASITRAALMGFIAILAPLVGRIYSVRNAIVLSALVMAVFNPEVLLSVGFQLSFLSLIGIVYLVPTIKKVFSLEERKTFLNWRENLLTTFSAQMMVAPLGLYYFGRLSFFSLAANMLILEAVPYAMAMGGILGVFGFFGDWLIFAGKTFGWFAFVVLKYQVIIIDFFANSFQWSAFNMEKGKISLFFVAGYYLIVAIIINRYKTRRFSDKNF